MIPRGQGVQLTEAQRRQLADSLHPQDGLRPHQLHDTGLISPLFQDNSGQELHLKLQQNWSITDNLFLNQQLQYRNSQQLSRAKEVLVFDPASLHPLSGTPPPNTAKTFSNVML